jgi:hypothetical protein
MTSLQPQRLQGDSTQQQCRRRRSSSSSPLEFEAKVQHQHAHSHTLNVWQMLRSSVQSICHAGSVRLLTLLLLLSLVWKWCQ